MAANEEIEPEDPDVSCDHLANEPLHDTYTVVRLPPRASMSMEELINAQPAPLPVQPVPRKEQEQEEQADKRMKCVHWWKKNVLTESHESPTQSSTSSSLSLPPSPTSPTCCDPHHSSCRFCAQDQDQDQDQDRVVLTPATKDSTDLKRGSHGATRQLYSLSSSNSSCVSSASTTNILEASAIQNRRPSPRRRHSSSSTSQRSWTRNFSLASWRKRLSRSIKGVKYSHDGAVAHCRFCEILSAKSEEFLYEDEFVVVFRPLFPIADSHVLVVPKIHIQNVKKLTYDHVFLLERMKQVAEFVLLGQEEVGGDSHGFNFSSCASSPDVGQLNQAWYIPSPTESNSDVLMASCSCSNADSNSPRTELKYAFHLPPFNSIDHVHMHVFRRHARGSGGVVNTVKFQTKTWWCHSYDQVLSRLYRQRHVKS